MSLVGAAEAAAAGAAQKIADHFSSVQTMSGEFVQFGPRGEQTGGKFYIQRPGKIRFNYEAPSSTTVISDGKSVVIENIKLKTADLYPLSKTPLKLLLDDNIDLSGNKVKSVKEEDDLTTIQLADKSVFGNRQDHHDVRPESLRSAAVDDHRRAGQGHHGDDLQRQAGREVRPGAVQDQHAAPAGIQPGAAHSAELFRFNVDDTSRRLVSARPLLAVIRYCLVLPGNFRCRLTIATWNINSVRLRLPIVEHLLDDYSPDMLCLQETKCPDELFPHRRIRGARL